MKTNAVERLRVTTNGTVLLPNSNNTAEELRFLEPSASGVNYTGFKAQAQTVDVTYTLPSADGTNGQLLTTNGSGLLSWTTPSASSLWQLGTGTLSLVGIGFGNTSGGNYAISAGQNNAASGTNAVAIGGLGNTSSGSYAVVSGGQTNQSTGINTTVGGGLSNTASGSYAVVAGGQTNVASGINTAVGGGINNQATGNYAVVAGGQSNVATNTNATVAGGSSNTANGDHSFIGGGGSNQSQGTYSTIAGGQSNVTAAAAQYSTIAGGLSNQVSGNYSFIGGGQNNSAGTASNSHAVVGGGLSNSASGDKASVLGGQTNAASGQYSATLGGLGNSATGQYAIALGGQSVTAGGQHSLAFGNGAAANSTSMVVFNHAGSAQNTLFGIRTNLPTEALDVNGNVKFSGALMPNNLPGTSGYFLTSQGANTPPVWTNLGSVYWSLTGNAGTTPGTNFLGTTDAQDLRIRTNNQDRITVTSGGNTVINATSGNTKLDVNGDLAMRQSAITLSSGNNNNISVGSTSFTRITGPSGAFTITGLTNGVDGKIVTLYNATSQSMTIADDNSNSTAANRIYTLNPVGDITIYGKGAITLQYSSADSRWIAITPGTTNSTSPTMMVLRKPSDESVTSSTTLQDDDDLFFAIGANQVYMVEGYLHLTSTSTTPNAKMGFTIPTGASMNIGEHWSHNGDQSQEMDVDVSTTSGTATAQIPISANANNVVFYRGTIVNGSTAGVVHLQWSQNSSNATALKAKAGSNMTVIRIQ